MPFGSIETGLIDMGHLILSGVVAALAAALIGHIAFHRGRNGRIVKVSAETIDSVARVRIDQLIKDLHARGDTDGIQREIERVNSAYTSLYGDMNNLRERLAHIETNGVEDIRARERLDAVIKDANALAAKLTSRVKAIEDAGTGVEKALRAHARLDALRDHPKGLAGWKASEQDEA